MQPHRHRSMAARARIRAPAAGFTLLELLLAVALLGLITVITYVAFSTVALAWQRGTQMADALNHADYVVEQLVMALRSTYYPSTGVDGHYGFQFKDGGDGSGAGDEASWVKLGAALVGRDAVFAGGPHRVQVVLGETERGQSALAVRSWGTLAEVDDFEPEDLPQTFLPGKVQGINYRFADPESEETDKIEWIDDWEESNRVPAVVELTVYMEPVEEYGAPVEVKRIVRIPLSVLAWPEGGGPPSAAAPAPGPTTPPAGTPPASGRKTPVVPGPQIPPQPVRIGVPVPGAPPATEGAAP